MYLIPNSAKQMFSRHLCTQEQHYSRLKLGGVVAHTFSPSTWQRQVDLCESEASLVYIGEFQASQKYVVRPCLK